MPVSVACTHASGDDIDPPYGALAEFVRDIQAVRATVYQAAGRLRDWRM